MHPAKASKKVQGKVKWRIRYWDGDKLKTVPNKITGDLWSRKEAEKWISANRENEDIEHVKRHSDAIKWLKWKDKHVRIRIALDEYIEWYKDKAPNSYTNSRSYLDRYVIRFFLEVQKVNKLTEWHKYHKEFRKFLKDKAFKVGTETPIAYSTKNHCIIAYNNFMKFMLSERWINHEHFSPCPTFEDRLVKQNSRTYKDIVSKDEYKKLLKNLDASKDFTIIAFNTGLRFNELVSLPFNSIHESNDLLPEFMKEKYKNIKEEIYGYIVLKDQIATSTPQRDENGHFKRKPLKGRRAISLKDARIIPIIDFECWSVIVKHYNIALENFERREYGSSREEDYLLLDIPVNAIRKDFRKHCKKGIHALRHSFTTNLIGSSIAGGDARIVRMITGHRCEKVFDRYNHIYEEAALAATEKSKKRRSPLRLVSSKKAS